MNDLLNAMEEGNHGECKDNMHLQLCYPIAICTVYLLIQSLIKYNV